MKVLVYIETKEGSPVQGSLELLTAAKELVEPTRQYPLCFISPNAVRSWDML